MHFSKIILVSLVAFVCSSVADDEDYRLPYNYILDHYDIDLVIPAESLTEKSSNYSGSVAIKFQVIESTTTVKLHANASNIVLNEISLNDEELKLQSSNVNNVTNILTLEFDSELISGKNYTLNINFKAQLLSGGGFYKVPYTDHDNIIRYTATTQFQSTSARNAFPCFDEPVYKATFAYYLTYPAEFNAWTNTPSIANDTLDDDLVKTQFDVSPRMSVYLVAFTISRYTCEEGDLEGTSEFKHRVCSREDKADARKWAMEVTPKVIEHLKSYTNFPYTSAISKLDQMAVPGKNGAMENWGLVIYGESSLLFDNTLQTTATKQSVAGIISHELAHMWFGNLLTCRWWSETFLNEGFASLFQYYTTHYVDPEFEMEKQFVVRTLQYVLEIEAYTGVPALRSNASTPSEINDKFGTYTYNKGASVLRMIEHILGRETFKEGIKLYIDFDLGDVARSGCFLILNVALDNLELYGFDINVPDKNSNCLLHYSAKHGNTETTLKLLTLKALPDVVNARKQTPLHLACIHQHKPIIDILVNNNAKMNIRDYLGQTPLFYLVDSPSLAEFFIAQGADINISNSTGETLLHLAVKAGEKSLVQYVLEHGLHVDAKTACGDTPIMLAVQRGFAEIVDVLLEYGADLKIQNHKNQNLMHLAVASHQNEICGRLLPLGLNLNQQDRDGVSPLHLAAQRNYCDIIQILADNNAKIDQRDFDNYTPLHVAASKKQNGHAVAVLLRNRASIDAVTCNGDLPLHKAAGSGNEKAARLLYQKAFLSVENRCGLTPLMMAEAHDRRSVVYILKELEMREKLKATSAIPVKK